MPDHGGDSAASLPIVREAYSAPPRSFIQVGRLPNRPLLIDPRTYLSELDEVCTHTRLDRLVLLAEMLFEVVQQRQADGSWEADQSVRHSCARMLGDLEALIALVELTDGGCRRALGMSPLDAASRPPQALIEYAIHWFGGQLAHTLTQHLPHTTAMTCLMLACNQQAAAARQTILKDRDKLVAYGGNYEH